MASIHRQESAGIIQLSLDQPNSTVNVLSRAFWLELQTHLNDITEDPPLRGVMISSHKRDHFCAGIAINELAPLIGNTTAIEEYMTLGRQVLEQLEHLPCATVAMIEGDCIGAGVELALACDYRVVSLTETFQLGFPDIQLGLMPGYGGTQRLARLVGVESAISRLLSGSLYNEEDLPEEDLIDEIAPADEIIAVAAQMLDVGEGSDIRQVKQARVEAELLPSTDFLHQVPNLVALLSPETMPSGLEIVRVVMEGALKSFRDGQQIEADAFAKLLGTDVFRKQFERLHADQRKG